MMQIVKNATAPGTLDSQACQRLNNEPRGCLRGRCLFFCYVILIAVVEMIEESAIDDMNRIATDVLCCPECMSDDVYEKGCEYDEDMEVTLLHMKCKDCDYVFTHEA